MNIDILVFASHPDDIELTCAGTIISHIKKGYKVAIVDLTQGELGTRGTAKTRLEEANLAAQIMGISTRINLGLKDGFFSNDKENQMPVIKAIRQLRPKMVLANAIYDRHPDHGRGARLIADSCFLAGLKKVETDDAEGKTQEPWRPFIVYNYIQDRYIKPDLIVDITPFWNKKLEAINAFKSQFFDPTSTENQTYISSPTFLPFIEARAREFGHAIGVEFGEGFTVERTPGVKDLFDLI